MTEDELTGAIRELSEIQATWAATVIRELRGLLAQRQRERESWERLTAA